MRTLKSCLVAAWRGRGARCASFPAVSCEQCAVPSYPTVLYEYPSANEYTSVLRTASILTGSLGRWM
jgi:hypothetical protein